VSLRTRKKFRKNVRSDPSGCWEWIGYRDHRGYGRFYNPEKQQEVAAHRWLWEHANGRRIPKGMDAHHTCWNRSCVQPDHIAIMPHREHMRIHAATGVWSGENNGRAKRTETDIYVIHFLTQMGFSRRMLSKAMDIPLRSVYAVINRECWSYLEIPERLHEWNAV